MKIREMREHFGFIRLEKATAIYPEDFSQADNLEEKVEYLNAMVDQEESRMGAIESKIGQLIGMTSIVFTLLGIFVANYLSKFSALPCWLQTLMIAVYVVSLGFYINTIFQASRYLDITKHAYGQRGVSTVRKAFADKKAFLLEEAKDLIYMAEKNSKVNDQKATYLSFGYQSFKSATIGIALLSVIMLLSGKFSNPQILTNVAVVQPVTISHLDSSLRNSIPIPSTPRIILIHDTIYLKR